jgi:hypothetical protein
MPEVLRALPELPQANKSHEQAITFLHTQTQTEHVTFPGHSAMHKTTSRNISYSS